MNLPLFPLSSHILPQGRMALRIFEPRYVRMVKESCASDQGFVICMLDSKGETKNNTHFYPVGTLCKVIDFDMLDDGLLGVTVEGLSCVNIISVETENDGLRVAECENVSTWHCEIGKQEIYPLNERLKEIFDRYPEISELYEETRFDDPTWVMNRWIELLPVGAEKKQHFIAQKDCSVALKYLSQLIE